MPLDFLSKASRRVRISRLAVRCRITVFMFWMIGLSLYLLGLLGSFTYLEVG